MKTKLLITIVSILLISVAPGCGTQKESQRGFFTSGNREADQRASQRMAGVEQMRGPSTNPLAPQPKSLYDRLGGEPVIARIVDDFVTRILADPRVNFSRQGVKRGGMSVHRGKSVEWQPTGDKIDQLKKHLVQFLSLSTGGPSFYDGLQIKDAHDDMHISNTEFDASIGDLKASLDKLQIADKEQRELLSIVESTRTQIVTER